MTAFPGVRAVLAVSPHLDDVVFSCGALLADLQLRGVEVTVATVFTASVPDPTGFALACQLDKGLPADVDYLALRRDEDLAAMAALGVPAERVHHLGLREAPHRGYTCAPDLFGPIHPDDVEQPAAVASVLAPLLAAGPDLVLGPQALGNHVDHRHVRAALDVSRPAGALLLYADTPYALRAGSRRAAERGVAVSADGLAAKLAACAQYPTQLGFQFGGQAGMREQVGRFAVVEGQRLGVGGPAEALLPA